MQHSTRNRSNFNISSENSNTNNDDDKNIAQRFHALNAAYYFLFMFAY